MVDKELAYEDKYVITDASCFETEETITYTHNTNMTEEELATCVTYLENAGMSLADGTMTAFCQGAGTTETGATFQENLDNGDFSEHNLIYLEENNIITSEFGLSITGYDTICGSDVVIPKTINEQNVTIIGEYAFSGNDLTSVVIPNSVTEIKYGAFGSNHLASVIFEEKSQLTFIGSNAFSYNQIENIEIPNTVTYIGMFSFAYNEFTNVDIPDSVETLACNAFFRDDGVEVKINARSELACISNSCSLPDASCES